MSTFTMKFKDAEYNPDYVADVIESMRRRMEGDVLKKIPDTNFVVEPPPAKPSPTKPTTGDAILVTEEHPPPPITVTYQGEHGPRVAKFTLRGWDTY